jgi:hypothetical protein
MAPSQVVGQRRADAKARDAFVVHSDPLSTLLHGFVTSWEKSRPRETGGKFISGNRRQEIVPISPVAWLETESGVSRHQISNILRRRTRFTELRVADSLVAAVGRPDAFYDGTLDVIENPHASRATRDVEAQQSLTGNGAL